MFGLVLAKGIGVDQNLDRALEVLRNGCMNGRDDPACEGAIQLAEQIQVARRAPTKPPKEPAAGYWSKV